MRYLANRCKLALFLILLPFQIFAAGTITSPGGASLTINGFGSLGFTSSTDNIGQGDQLFSFGFWYRTATDTREYSVSADGPPDVLEDYSGAVGNFQWSDIGGRGLFDALVEVEIIDGPVAGEAFIVYRLELMPIPDSPIADLEIFFYVDPDLDGTAGGDTADQGIFEDIEVIVVRDSTCMSTTAFRNSLIADPVPDAFQVASWPQLRTSLNNDTITNLDNSGVPFSSGDAVVGFQISGENPDSNNGWIGFTAFQDCTEDYVPVPGPGNLALAILAMLMLGGAWHFRGRMI